MKIEINNTNYPEILRKIKNPPKQLYVKGNIDLLKTSSIAIIGSRSNTKYGEEMALKFSKELSLNGITIISGLAKGIDAFAHKSALEAAGNTIAVLPSGLNNIYPNENIFLYKKILEKGGLVITEYDKNTKADSNKFLERNRIVAGLSIGVLVIEGGYRSGTSVTARIAKQQNKKVFCIPSSLQNNKGITPNKLIQSGAIMVTSFKDIIREYPELKLKKVEQKNVDEIDIIDDEYKEVYKLLKKDKPTHINEIIKNTDFNIQDISYKLMMLELDGKIISLPGQNFLKR